MNVEDFIDDSKDAGELGSGHQVTALYEIILTGVKSEFSKELPELKYSEKKSKIDFGNELATIKFKYKKPDGNKSIEMIEVIENQLDANVNENSNFAASVAWFGLCLRDSKFIAKKKFARNNSISPKIKNL